MKKFIYLCGMMLLNLNMMAQIGSNYLGWDMIFNEDFNTSGRSWNTQSFLSSDNLWRAYPGYGVTNGDYPMVYQFTHCHFNDIEGVMELISEYDNQGDIQDNNYYLPKWMWPSQGGPGFPQSNNLFFFSGNIDYVNYDHQAQTIDKFLFGYFEIRCKLPLHNGSWPAFWLVGNGPNTYEEIDIFEYTNHDDCENDTLWGFSSGIWHNPNGTNYNYNGSNDGAYKVFENHHHLSHNGPDLRDYHTYGCEWMPNYVRWYCDGVLTAEYQNTEHIPQYPKTLKITYGLKDYSLNDNNHPDGWSGSDIMTIDYVRVYALKTDCETDEQITSGIQFTNYDNKIKHSITIGTQNGSVIVPSNSNVFMRASDFILIDGVFEIPANTQITLSVHECPPQTIVITSSNH